MNIIDRKAALRAGGALAWLGFGDPDEEGQKGSGWHRERVLSFVSWGAILVGLYLLFRDLALAGLTWDEWLDYDLARDYLINQSYLSNLDDPSQGRLSHLVAAASFDALGVSYFEFKLPFVLIGIGGGAALWLFLSALVGPVVAWLAAAFYFTCPYVLAACRTGATAGDSLVMVTTLGFVITLYYWLRTHRFWPYGASCGVVCGLAIGAKWTCALLLVSVALAWLSELLRQRRLRLERPIWVGVLAHQGIAVAVAFLASPTLLLGVPFVKSALAHSLKFDTLAMLQFGEMRTAAPAYYVPAVFISKFSIPQLMVVVWELSVIGLLWVRKARKIGRLPLVCLLSLLPLVPLATKGFQNGHYYVGAIPAVMILSALALKRWLGSPNHLSRQVATWLSAVSLLGQLVLVIYLAPDYLLAGRQFGERFNGQFAGPAVNHCQGLPYAIREMNRHIEREDGPRVAYALRSCVDVLAHAAEHGPVKALARVAGYPGFGATEAHFLVVPSSYDYDSIGELDRTHAAALRREATARCRQTGPGHVDYELWLCPARAVD